MPLLEISKRQERETRHQREIREKLEKDGAMADGLTYTNKVAGDSQRDQERLERDGSMANID